MTSSEQPTLAGPDESIVVRRAAALGRGDVVGRYIVVRRLGEGGMGVVFAAYDPDLDRKVALKLLKTAGRDAQATAGRGRLVREAQAMAKLAHPNVISVFDVGESVIEDVPTVFVAMEYVEGPDLAVWLTKPHTWREVLTVFMAAGRGLAAAHASGLVHRDFKPANVLVGDDGRVRVLDFGLARRGGEPTRASTASSGDAVRAALARKPRGIAGTNTEDLTQTGAAMGTPAYMPPEQHLGEQVDARSDQFSFCVALYEALFDRRPFAGDTHAALAFSVLEGEARPPPRGSPIPRRIQRAIMRGLSRAPERRFADMATLLRELDVDPRRSLRAIGAGLGLLAGVVSLAWGTWTMTRPGIVEVSVRDVHGPVASARVQVGERALARVGDVAQGELPAGTYALHVEAVGYEPRTQVVTVQRGATAQLEVVLRREQGIFDLDVLPRGGAVLVDGIDYGGRLKNVAIDTGTHAIEVQMSGHRSVSMVWEAVAGVTQRGFVYLPRAVRWQTRAAGDSLDLLAIGDADGDGVGDVVFRNFGTITAYDGRDGRVLWRESLGLASDQPTAWADLDGDGVLDVVALRRAPQHVVTAHSGRDGRRLWEVAVPSGCGASATTLEGAEFIDLDADGRLEVVIGSHWASCVTAHRGHDGGLVWRHALDRVRGVAVGGDRAGDASVFAIASDAIEALDRGGRVQWRVPHTFVHDASDRQRLASLAIRATEGVPWNGTVSRAPEGDDLWVRALSPEDPERLVLRFVSGADGRLLWETDGRENVRTDVDRAMIRDEEGRARGIMLEGTERMDVRDPTNGAPLWSLLGPGRSGPLARPGGPPLVWRSQKERFGLYDATTGTRLFEAETTGPIASLPVTSDWDGDGVTELVFSTTEPAIQAVDWEGRPVGRMVIDGRAGRLFDVGDLDGDGMDDLLFGGQGLAVAFGQSVQWQREALDPFRSIPGVADLDGDGNPEIVAFASMVGNVSQKHLEVIDARTGDTIWRAQSAGFVGATPAFVAAEDGTLDVIVTSALAASSKDSLRRYSGRDGTLLAEAEIPKSWAPGAVVDLGGDGRMEVIVLAWDDAPAVQAFDAETLQPLWSYAEADAAIGAAVQGVVGPDRSQGVIIGFESGALRAFGPDGVLHWSRDLGDRVFRDLWAGDLDGDGWTDALVDRKVGEAYELVAISGRDGGELWSTPTPALVGAPVVVPEAATVGGVHIVLATRGGVVALGPDRAPLWSYAGRGEFRGAQTVVVTNFEGDDHKEVLAGFSDGRLRALDLQSGALLWEYRTDAEPLEALPVPIDVDGDGRLEVIVAGRDRMLTCLRVPARRR